MKKPLIIVGVALAMSACEGHVTAEQIKYGAAQCKKHDGLDAFLASSISPTMDNEALCEDGVRIDLDLADKK